MILENELFDFTNWLVDNDWKLVGNGMCLNSNTKKLSSISELVIQSKTVDFCPQEFKVGDVIRDKDNNYEIEIKRVEYAPYDREYEYWYEDEDGNEWCVFAGQFEKIK